MMDAKNNFNKFAVVIERFPVSTGKCIETQMTDMLQITECKIEIIIIKKATVSAMLSWNSFKRAQP